MTKRSTKRTTPGSPRRQSPRRVSERVVSGGTAFETERIAWLRDLYPEAVSEDRIDFDRLKETLGEATVDGPERYSFTWAGKRDAIQLLQMPSRATLVPVPKESLSFGEPGSLFIEGDNLEVLKLLYKSYFGRVKVIYIDPPYNTGNDFVYRDNYTDPLDSYLQMTGQKDAEGNLLTTNPETSGRYHSAWLSMLHPRLFIARQLLQEDGVIFVSIDEHEVHNLRLLMNEVFGEENFIAQVTVMTNPKGRVLREHFATTHDYMLVFARDAKRVELTVEKTDEEIEHDYPEENAKGRFRWLELRNTHRQFGKFNRPNLYYPFFVDESDGSVSLGRTKTHKVEVLPLWDDGFEGCWSWGTQKVSRQLDELISRKVNGNWKVFRKGYVTSKKLQTIWTEREYHTEVGQAEFNKLMSGRIFDAPKPVALIKRCVELATDGAGDVVLDFFAGSGTTVQAVLELNRSDGGSRRCISVQLPEPTPEGSAASKAGFETIADISKERARRVIANLKKDKSDQLELRGDVTEELGFRVFRLAPSNFKAWAGVEDNDPEAYAEQMALFADSLAGGWKAETVLWEIALGEGLTLSSQIEQVKAIKSNVVWRVSDSESGQARLVCLDESLRPETVKALNLTAVDTFICRDSALTDEQAANLALQCRLKAV